MEAIKYVSFSINEGVLTGLVGPSGSGKTTLLNLLGLIEPVQKGSLKWRGQELTGLKETAKNKIRRYEVGYIFQSFQLFPVLSAEENVAYFLSRQGVRAEQVAVKVKEALHAVGLWEHRMKRPLEMSGGQRQRVAIARALAKTPKVIIADEPTASLDQKTGMEVMEILQRLAKEGKTTVLISSHDPMVQGRMQRLIRLADGEVVS